MQSRATLFLALVAAILGFLAPVDGQSRRVLGTIAAKAPVTLLPDPSRTPLATLPEGTQVQVLSEEDGWYRILFQDNYVLGDRVGYVRAELVRVSGRLPELTPEPESTTGIPSAGMRREEVPGSLRPNTTANSSEANTSARQAGVDRDTRHGLRESDVATAIVRGLRQRGATPGLRLLDTGETGTQVPESGRTAPRPLFRLQIHTPLSWIQQLASEAARSSRRFGLDDVTDEMTKPVLRVTAYSEVAPRARGTAGSSWVRHAVLRDGSGRLVIQPISKEAFSEHVLRAAGGSTVAEGVVLTFPLDAVRRLRDESGETAFFITVLGPAGEKKDLRIQAKDVAALPM